MDWISCLYLRALKSDLIFCSTTQSKQINISTKTLQILVFILVSSRLRWDDPLLFLFHQSHRSHSIMPAKANIEIRRVTTTTLGLKFFMRQEKKISVLNAIHGFTLFAITKSRKNLNVEIPPIIGYFRQRKYQDWGSQTREQIIPAGHVSGWLTQC